MTEINYQEAINVIVQMMSISYPIVVIFLVTEKAVNMFSSFVFGKEVKI